MLSMKTLMLLSALVLPATGYEQSATGLIGRPGTSVQDVSFCQLTKSPAQFAGRTIRVRGIYWYALEMNGFEPAECCPEKIGDHLHAIIDGNPMYPDAHSERLAWKLTAKMSATALVVFVGTLTGSVLEVERVESIEKLSHPKDRDHEPLWARQNCGPIHAPSE
jgi:hypothetical protein